MAAVLACGQGALLSHRSAAALWDIRRSEARRVDVMVPGRGGGPRRGIKLHRLAGLTSVDWAVLNAIPVTSVALTLLGVAQELRPSDVERALESAERRRILDMRAVEEVIVRYRGCRGVAVLRDITLRLREPEDVREELERRFASFCRRCKLQRPVFNTLVEGYLVDVLWRGQRLIVELDSWTWHSQRSSFEDDRIRDAKLQLAGYTVLRITWRRLTEEPEAIAAMIRQALRRA